MRIDRLTGIPSEDQLSDHVIDIIRRNPNWICSTLSKFGNVSLPVSNCEIYSRNQLAAIFPDSTASLGKLEPDIILNFHTHIVLIEVKRDATLKSGQLPNYIQGVTEIKKQKLPLYFLLAPRTSRYSGIPSEVIQITWDQLYDSLEDNDKQITTSTIGRFRLYLFQSIFDEVLESLRKEFSSLPYVSPKPTSDYYGIHFTLPQCNAVIFSLAIFLQSPSYLKLFPFKVKYKGKLKSFNEDHPFIQNYRTALLTLPRTVHALKASYPGYVLDLYPHPGNSVASISDEVKEIFNKDCQEMISIYQSIQ